MNRTAKTVRDTSETKVAVELDLDGTGRHDVSTGVPFLNHMLELLARHSLVDLDIRATGDTDVDDHHTVEDVGLVVGSCIGRALGDHRGIRRYGSALVPMDDALAQVAIDLGGRPFLVYDVKCPRERIKSFDVRLVEEFFRALATEARMNLHVRVLYGDEPHHVLESVFKGFARALREAVERDPREAGIPSSKGLL